MPSTLLSRFPLARCADIEEFLPLVHQAFGVPHGRAVGPLPRAKPYELRGITDPQFTIGLLRNAIGVSIDGRHLGGSYFVNFGVSGKVLSERGAERLVNCPDVAAVFNPGDSHVLLPDLDGAETLGIRLDRALVTRELAMLLGHEPDGPVAFDFALHLTRTRTAGLRHGHSPFRPRHLRYALGYIEAHLAGPMTLGDIAQAAGCSARTLNDTFQEHFSVSPMSRVRQLRLDRAHADLLDGAVSVTEAACRWGFPHLGRFSGAYYERFGELPSQTRGRA
jgi:AraC-like DNA-binding protein